MLMNSNISSSHWTRRITTIFLNQKREFVSKRICDRQIKLTEEHVISLVFYGGKKEIITISPDITRRSFESRFFGFGFPGLDQKGDNG